MEEFLATAPNKNGVCFIFLGDVLLAKVTPIKESALRMVFDDAGENSLVCEHSTGGTFHYPNMEEVLRAVKEHATKLALCLSAHTEGVG